MGRPIKKKFFANLNSPYQDHATGGLTGSGGEGVASSITVTSSGTNYSRGSALVFSAPQIPGGVTATGTPVLTGLGLAGITAVTLTNAGSGYSSTASITVTTATAVSKASTGTIGDTEIYPANVTGIFIGMAVTGSGVDTGAKVTAVGTNSVTLSVANVSTVSSTLSFVDLGTGFAAITALTSARSNGLVVTAFLSTGSSAVVSDIMKQEASARYLVRNAQGKGQCKLVAKDDGALAAGEMNMIATDVNGSTYYVRKLTARKALLTRKTMVGAYEFATGARAGWTTGSATTGTVSVSNV